MSVQVSKSNIGTIISLVIHGLLLLALFMKTVERLQPNPIGEGLLVQLGEVDETSLGEEAFGETSEISISEIDNSINSSPTTQDDKVLTSEVDETIKKTEAKTKTAKDVKKINPPIENKNNKSTSTSKDDSNSKSKEQLEENKKKFGSLFGSGQGSKEGNGNQGDPGGGPDSKILEGISKGVGTVGGGLNGRKVVSAPTLSESSQKYGKVTVKVCVDKNGKVISSKFTQKGSTTTDSQLVKIAEKGGMKYVFAPGELDNQCGTISFDFKLN